jgi:hypothetical protein
MSNFLTIDVRSLSTVNGGAAPAPNCTRTSGQIQVTAPGVNVNGRGSYEACRTDYASCLDATRGKSPDEIVATCGLPPRRR